MLAHLQNKPHGKPPFFIQLATISHLLVRHSLEVPLILVASRMPCKWMHSVDSRGMKNRKDTDASSTASASTLKSSRSSCMILRERRETSSSSELVGLKVSSRVYCEVVCNVHSVRSCVPISRNRRLSHPLMLLGSGAWERYIPLVALTVEIHLSLVYSTSVSTIQE